MTFEEAEAVGFVFHTRRMTAEGASEQAALEGMRDPHSEWTVVKQPRDEVQDEFAENSLDEFLVLRRPKLTEHTHKVLPASSAELTPDNLKAAAKRLIECKYDRENGEFLVEDGKSYSRSFDGLRVAQAYLKLLKTNSGESS